MSAPEPAKASQRVAATAINTVIICGFAAFAEWIAATSSAPNPAARAMVALQALFGISVIFWLICGQARSSPGLALMKLKLQSTEDPTQRPNLIIALIRPLPFFLMLALVITPTGMVPRSLGPAHFILVLITALFLAANATPIWSGPDRRSLLDKWLRMRVVRK